MRSGEADDEPLTLYNLMKMNFATCERTKSIKYCLNVKWINDGNKCQSSRLHCGMPNNLIVGIMAAALAIKSIKKYIFALSVDFIS